MGRSLAAVAGIDQLVASQRFEACWKPLEEKIEAARLVWEGGARACLQHTVLPGPYRGDVRTPATKLTAR